MGNRQAACRKGHCTADHIFALKSIINGYIKRNKGKVHACFVDFTKAFDTIPREYLFYEVKKRLGINGNFYKLIKICTVVPATGLSSDAS